jgi:anti-sigma B factor antagonist
VTTELPVHGDERPEMTLDQPADGIRALRVHCEIDVLTASALWRLLEQELNAGHCGLVLDLDGCTFMGSSGLAVLVAAREQSKATATPFVLAGPNRSVTRALQTTGLAPLFTTFPTAAAAVTSLTHGGTDA